MSILKQYTLTNVANVYTLLWLFYYMQGTLYPSGSSIGIAVMSIFLLVSLFFFCKVNRKGYIPSYLKGLNVLFVLFSIYGIIRIVDAETIYRANGVLQNPTTYLKSYYISILPTYALYYFANKGKINADWIRNWAFVFITFSVFQYFNSEATMMEMLSQKGIEAELLTNNMGYSFVSLMCLIPFFSKKPLIQYIILALCGFFVISSAKRGALICYAISASVFLWYNLRHSSSRKKFIAFVLGVCCLYGAYSYMNFMISTNASFASRFIMDISNSSGRDDLYSQVLDYISNETSVFRLIFGNGADGSIVLLGNFAHNDWLEFAINMGILGVLAFFVYNVIFVRTIRYAQNASIRMALLFIYIPFVLKSVFSMAIGDFHLYESAVLAFCLVYLYKPEYVYLNTEQFH